MESGIETGLNTGRVVRKFFLFAILLLILILYSVTSSIFEKTGLGIMNNCLESKIGDPIFINDDIIISAKTATLVLNNYFNETHNFLKADLSECGATYIFNGVNTKYMVCENGKVYFYGKICKTKTIKEKSAALIGTLTNTTK